MWMGCPCAPMLHGVSAAVWKLTYRSPRLCCSHTKGNPCPPPCLWQFSGAGQQKTGDLHTDWGPGRKRRQGEMSLKLHLNSGPGSHLACSAPPKFRLCLFLSTYVQRQPCLYKEPGCALWNMTSNVVLSKPGVALIT